MMRDLGRFGFLYTRVTPSVLFAASRRNMLAHRVTEVRAAWQDGRLFYQCAWLCGDGSDDSVLLASTAYVTSCRRCTDINAGPAVYRCFDGDDQLLYVGSSIMVAARQLQHSKSSSWWPAVTQTTVERFPTIAQARHAEALAIAREHPLHNVRLRNAQICHEVPA